MLKRTFGSPGGPNAREHAKLTPPKIRPSRESVEPQQSAATVENRIERSTVRRGILPTCVERSAKDQSIIEDEDVGHESAGSIVVNAVGKVDVIRHVEHLPVHRLDQRIRSQPPRPYT